MPGALCCAAARRSGGRVVGWTHRKGEAARELLHEFADEGALTHARRPCKHQHLRAGLDVLALGLRASRCSARDSSSAATPRTRTGRTRSAQSPARHPRRSWPLPSPPRRCPGKPRRCRTARTPAHRVRRGAAHACATSVRVACAERGTEGGGGTQHTDGCGGQGAPSARRRGCCCGCRQRGPWRSGVCDRTPWCASVRTGSGRAAAWPWAIVCVG